MHATKAGKLTGIALSVFRLNGQLLEWGDHFSAPDGLSSARWQVLGAIALADSAPSIPQIAAAMGISRQAVLKQINLLVEEGLVQAQPNPTHKRSPLHALTPRGEAAYRAIEKRWHAHVHELAKRFSAADLDAALHVLSALSALHEQAP